LVLPEGMMFGATPLSPSAKDIPFDSEALTCAALGFSSSEESSLLSSELRGLD
jgi:hypothetical protein